jgi:hypothetical protein
MRVAPGLRASRPTPENCCSLPYQVQPSQVFGCPADVREHRFEGADRRCVAEPMVGDHYSPPIRVAKHQVTPSRSGQAEPVSVECPQQRASGDARREIAHTLTATAGVGHSKAPH